MQAIGPNPGLQVTQRGADTRTAIEGWRLVGTTAAVVAVVVAARLLTLGFTEAGVRGGIRSTAQISFVLFTCAFVASPLQRLRPGPLGRWLLRNRRYLGVSFAVSHFVHLALIVALAGASLEFRQSLAPGTIVGGGFAYVLIAAMTFTSFDRTAAWLGPRWWHRLHSTGMYYVWFIFFISYAPRAALQSVFYLPFPVILIAAMGARWLVRRRRPGRRASAPRLRSVGAAGAHEIG